MIQGGQKEKDFMGPAGPETNNDRADEGQQQIYPT
jgi:hypothetical protein